MSLPAHDRRKEQRKNLNEPVDIAFYFKGSLYSGSMIDISNSGARISLRLNEYDRVPSFSKDINIEWHVMTSNGTTRCKGSVKWTVMTNDRLRWGISFNNIPKLSDDPLQAIIRSHTRPSGRLSGEKLLKLSCSQGRIAAQVPSRIVA